MMMRQVSRRRFIVHSAHRTLGMAAGLECFRAALAAAEPARIARKVCLVSGSLEYKSDESLALFQEHLEKQLGAECHRAFRRADDDLPGLEHLEQADVAIFFTRRLTIAGEQLDRVKCYCDAGRPIVAIRTASHGFQNWLAVDREVLGGDYRGHYGNALLPEIRLADAAKGHPVLDGVEPCASAGSLYKNPEIAADNTLLMTGSIPEHTEPVAWTRLHRGGRVFYTSLGHPDDFRQPSFLRLLTNAVVWATERRS